MLLTILHTFHLSLILRGQMFPIRTVPLPEQLAQNTKICISIRHKSCVFNAQICLNNLPLMFLAAPLACLPCNGYQADGVERSEGEVESDILAKVVANLFDGWAEDEAVLPDFVQLFDSLIVVKRKGVDAVGFAICGQDWGAGHDFAPWMAWKAKVEFLKHFEKAGFYRLTVTDRDLAKSA